ncbi:MAG: transporter substrate-binding domain-containing protein [Ruminococcus sp.]|nr:transporter substrate-binding domain-containing protein [Ruminococcus sp.]
MKNLKKTLLILMLGAMTLSMTACGGAGSSSSQTDGSAKKDTEKAKVYQIATDTSFNPFAFPDETGKYVGIDIDLFEAIAEDQNIAFEYQHLGFDATCAALESNQADGAMCCLSIKEERKKIYDFSEPYYTSSVVCVVNASSDLKSFDDLKGKKVAAKIATDAEKYANDISAEYDAEVVALEDFSTAFMMLKSESVDAIIEDVTVVKTAMASDDTITQIGDEGYAAQIGFAVPKDKNPELLEKFNTGLKNIKANGKFDEIMDKYLK